MTLYFGCDADNSFLLKQCQRMFRHPYGKQLLIKVSIYDKVLLEYGLENRGAVK